MWDIRTNVIPGGGNEGIRININNLRKNLKVVELEISDALLGSARIFKRTRAADVSKANRLCSLDSLGNLLLEPEKKPAVASL